MEWTREDWNGADRIGKERKMKKTTRTQQVEQYEVPEVTVAPVRRVHCAIRGKAPLLMNIFKDGKDNRRDITPEQACEESLYMFKGEIVEPAVHVEKAMEKVSTGVRWENKKSYKDIIKAFVTVEPMFIKHKVPDWEVFSTPVVIRATKGRIMRHRPMFPEWELEFDIVIRNPQIEVAKIKHILVMAGEYNGIGDYRPKFGLFEVIKFDVE